MQLLKDLHPYLGEHSGRREYTRHTASIFSQCSTSSTALVDRVCMPITHAFGCSSEPRRSDSATQRTWSSVLFALSGIGSLSHEKKANFWRDICDTFPSLIDFLCSPQQGLKQARSVGMLVDVGSSGVTLCRGRRSFSPG